jgi:hypothetical protein
MTAMIPQIEFLDSTLVDQNARNKISNGMILEAASAMQLEQEELDDERRMEMAILGDEFNTAMGYLPSNGNDLTRSETSDRFPENSGHGVCPDTGSDLTHGSSVVLAGFYSPPPPSPLCRPGNKSFCRKYGHGYATSTPIHPSLGDRFEGHLL